MSKRRSQRWGPHQRSGNGARLVLALAVLLVSAVPARAVVAPLTADIVEELRFREEFGLETNLDYVLAVVSDPASNHEDYPVHLSPEERAELDARRAIAGSLDPLQQYGQVNTESFGGAYIDNRAGGMIDVAFVGDPEIHRASVEGLLPEGATVRLRQVEHSLASLDEIQEQIDDSEAAFVHDQLGFRVWETGIDIVNNVVHVGVSVVSDEVRAVLAERYGHSVLEVAEVGPGQLTGCTNRTNCPGPPLRAGIAGSYDCSLSFMVVWDGNNRMLTAGHCANPGSAWSTPGNSIGTMRLDSFEDGSTADAATLGGDISASDMDNWVYMRYNSHASVYSTQSTSDTIGGYICLSGKQYEYGRCGSIRLNDFTITYCTENTACDRPNINKWTLRAQRVGSYSYQFGDSGGAIWDGGTVAVGIQSGCRDTTADLDKYCDANQPVYSHVRLAFSYFYPISLYTGD